MFTMRTFAIALLTQSTAFASPYLKNLSRQSTAAPAPPLGAPGLSHGVHIVVDVNAAGNPQGNIMSGDGGITSPKQVTYLNFYSIAPHIDQDVDYCSYNLSTSLSDQSPYVHQATIGAGADIAQNAGSNPHFGNWLVGPFEGYTAGNNVVFDGSVGGYGQLRADGSMAGYPNGVECSAPPADLAANVKVCHDPDGGSNTLQLAAICQF